MMTGYVNPPCANRLLYASTVLECSSEQSKAPALKKCKWEMRDDWVRRWMSSEWVRWTELKAGEGGHKWLCAWRNGLWIVEHGWCVAWMAGWKMAGYDRSL